MKRVVLDTNVFISSTFWSGKPLEVVNVFKQERASLLLTTEIIEELFDVYSDEKFSSRLLFLEVTASKIVANHVELAEIVIPDPIPDDVIRDRKDLMILACAVGGNADYIVTGDKDLRTLGSYAGIPILTPARFLELMSTEEE